MLKNMENMENNKVKLEIEVAAPDVDTALARAYRKVVKEINLPGFRKGKVPRRILVSRFGPEVLFKDALDILMGPAYEAALEESGVDPIDQPEFELVQLEEGKPLLFNALIEIVPPVGLPEYRGVEAEQEEVEFDDLQVDHHLYMLREQNARLEPREEGVVRSGDLVTIDFRGYIDDEPFEGGEAENYSLEIGSKTFIPGFEDQLIGAEPGREKEVKVTFPEDYHKEELAGKEAVFKVTVKQVKEKKLPDLDDEFIKEISDFETLEEMKEDLKEKLLKNAEDQSKTKLEESLIETITDAAQVDPPGKLVERQIDRMIGDMENYLRYQGLGLDKFLEMSGKSMEELREDRQEEAIKRTKANLVLDAIAKKEEISVSEDDLEERIKEIAENYNDDPQRIKDIYAGQGRIPVLREELRIRRVVDLIVEAALIKKVKAKKPLPEENGAREATGEVEIAKEDTKG